jgi:hypothetical protein
LSFSYEQMVDEERIPNFGDYHKSSLYILKSTAREYVKGLKKGRQKRTECRIHLEKAKHGRRS